MSTTWNEGPAPEMPAPRGLGWLRVIARGVPMALVIFGGAVILVLLRLLERPIFGMKRPWTSRLTRVACLLALRIMGLQVRRQGATMRGQGAVVANHSSWLDIFVLNSQDQVYFVSKFEVSGWAGIGWLGKITDTVFIERDSKKSLDQMREFVKRLKCGQRLLFFPEGTSTDNQRVLPFKTTLFQAFMTEDLKDDLKVQPVSVNYHAPEGADPRFYGWWGDMEFVSNLLALLATRRHGWVEIVYHPPLHVCDFTSRKALAAAAEEAVRAGHRAK